MGCQITVDEAMLVSAVRYALGRSTYIVAQTAQQTIDVWSELSEEAQRVIEQDLADALNGGRTGMEMDTFQWMRLHEHIAMFRLAAHVTQRAQSLYMRHRKAAGDTSTTWDTIWPETQRKWIAQAREQIEAEAEALRLEAFAADMRRSSADR